MEPDYWYFIDLNLIIATLYLQYQDYFQLDLPDSYSLI